MLNETENWQRVGNNETPVDQNCDSSTASNLRKALQTWIMPDILHTLDKDI